MTESNMKSHPLIIIAATAVILTCLLAVGMMTGLIPSPLTRDRVEVEAKLEPPAAAPVREPATTSSRSSFADTRAAPRASTRERTAAAPAPAPATGRTSSAAPERRVEGGSAPAPKVAAVCNNCGTVTSVRAVTQQGEAGIVGPLAGSAIGGLVGSQIGGGSGKAAATIIGAAGGAAVGTEIERRRKATTSYVVNVRLNDGTTRSFTYGSTPGVESGDRVRVVDGRLVRDS